MEILNTLIRQEPNKATMKAVAISLCNLSVLKSCRKDMVKMNVIEILIEMLRSGVEDTVYFCTLTLSNLTAAADLRKIVAGKGAIAVLCTLLTSSHAKTCAVASKSLANFACDKDCRMMVIKAGAVGPMINLLFNDMEAVRHDAIGALCDLLSFSDTYSFIVDAGIVSSLAGITQHAMHLEAISLALFNITTYPGMHEKFCEQNGAKLLVELLLNPALVHLSPQILSSLANIAATKSTTPFLLKANIVQALWTPIQSSIPAGSNTAVMDVAAANKIASILMLLSTSVDACKQLVAEGGVLSLVQLARQHDDQTKLCVSAVFYNLSLKKVLSDHGFLDALVDLSSTSLNQRVVWCAMTFSNLSTFPRGRSMFGKNIKQVAPCLAMMMRSGCEESENIQKHCAIALCNSLSVWLKQEDIEHMVSTGLVQDLIVITVLRVNVDYIKENLAKALFNLLITQTTRELMVEQGIMSSLIRLSKQVQSHEVTSLCVTALQNLTCEPKLASFYVEKLLEMAAVNVLIGLAVVPMSGIEVRKMCAAALATLSRLPITHPYILKEPIIQCIYKVSSQRHCEDWVEKCAEVLLNLSNDPASHDELLKQGVVSCIAGCIEHGNAACRVLGIASLCNLSVSASSFAQITSDGMHSLISTLKHVHMPRETRMNALRTICNLVVEFEPARKEAVDEDVVPALSIMMKFLVGEGGGDGDSEEELAILAKIMREISYYSQGHVAIQDSKGTNLLLRLSKLENAEIKSDASVALLNLSTCTFVTQLIDDGVVEAIFWLTLQDLLGLTESVYERCSAVIRNLCTNERGINRVVLENKLMVVLKKMAVFEQNDEGSQVKYNACISLYNIACHQDSQELFARNGIIPTLVGLAEQGSATNCSAPIALRMRNIASAALHQFSQDLLKDPNIIAILMSLLTMDTAVLDDCEVILTVENMKSEVSKSWVSAQTTCEYSFSEVAPSWLNIVVERILTFLPGKVDLDQVKAVEGDGGGAQTVGRIVGEFQKMLVEHQKQTPKDFSLPLPGAELTMAAKIDLYKPEEFVEEADEEEEEEKAEEERKMAEAEAEAEKKEREKERRSHSRESGIGGKKFRRGSTMRGIGGIGGGGGGGGGGVGGVRGGGSRERTESGGGSRGARLSLSSGGGSRERLESGGGGRELGSRGESYDDDGGFGQLGAKLPALTPPVPPQDMVLDPSDPNYTLNLLSQDKAIMNDFTNPIGSGVQNAFGGQITTNVPILPPSAHGISEAGVKRGKSSKFANKEAMRDSFRMSQQKKAVQLEDDYKQMILLKQNGLF